jgi:putative transposase
LVKALPEPLPPAPGGPETAAERRRRRESMAMYGAAGLDRDLSRLAEALLAQAQAEGIELTGPDGILGRMTKMLIETAAEAELAHHLGYGWHEEADGSGNKRNGVTRRTVATEAGSIEVAIPRDRAGTFEPKILPKNARRLSGFDGQVLDLYAKGLTLGEIREHLAGFYGTEVSTELLSQVTDQIAEELAEWHNRPLDAVYPVLFVDAVHIKIRDGAVANRPVYLVIGITMHGAREVLGVWAGVGGEAASFWASVLGEVKNRGVRDALIVCCDGLVGLDKAIEGTWPQARVQRCIVQVTRAALRYVPGRAMGEVAAGLRNVYDAPTVEAAEIRFKEFAAQYEPLYPAAVASVRDAWAGIIPFLDLPREVRKAIYSTNMIESFNSRVRSAVERHGHLPNELAARKVVYLVVKGHGGWSKRTDPARKVNNWKLVLNQLVLHFGDRLGL